MPQFRVRLVDVADARPETLTVWADDARQAGLLAVKIARRLLGRHEFDIVETTDLLAPPASTKVKVRHRGPRPNGPVTVRFLSG